LINVFPVLILAHQQVFLPYHAPGPIGIATAASCFLLGASRVLVGDVNPTRLQPLMRMGCDVIDLSRHTDVRAAIRGILGTPFVDCGIDCVGFECHGCGGDHTEEKPTEVMKTLVDVVRFGGNIGLTGTCGASNPLDRVPTEPA